MAFFDSWRPCKSDTVVERRVATAAPRLLQWQAGGGRPRALPTGRRLYADSRAHLPAPVSLVRLPCLAAFSCCLQRLEVVLPLQPPVAAAGAAQRRRRQPDGAAAVWLCQCQPLWQRPGGSRRRRAQHKRRRRRQQPEQGGSQGRAAACRRAGVGPGLVPCQRRRRQRRRGPSGISERVQLSGGQLPPAGGAA